MDQAQEYGEYLEAVSRSCGVFCIDSLKPQITAINEAISEGDSVNVALIGRFKAGKSSFLNSLIGRDIMPVAALPLTSVITYVKYGPQDKAEVRFGNGETKSIPLNELADFITEEKNPENVKQVTRVDVALADLKDYANIQFVDTPGLGSIFKHNTLTSTGWLPKIGAAFLSISVDHPLSEDDISLLRELENYTPEINILLTKIDLVSSKDSVEVARFIRQQVSRHLRKELKVFSFSIKPGFEPQRKTVFDFIMKSIAGDRFRKSKEIISHKLRATISKCVDYLELALSAADSAQESRQHLSGQLQQERRNLSGIENEIRVIATDTKSRLREDFYERFQGPYSRLRDKLREELKDQMPHWKGTLDKTTEIFREWLGDALTKELEAVSDEMGPKFAEEYLTLC